jgi:uncharacterized membrane protein
MRQAFWIFSVIAALAVAMPVARAADPPAAPPPHIKGLWLTTDYPASAVRAGESASIKLKLQNYDLPPEAVALSLDGVPQGWKATLLGNGAPVTAAMPGTNENVALTLRVDVPQNAGAGAHQLVLHAKSADANSNLPLDLTIGQDLPTQLGIKAKLPSLRGTPTTSFEYQFTVNNQSDKDIVVKLAAQAPPGFQTTFTEAYGTQELSSVPIEAGKDKDLKVKVQPPADVAAGDYPVLVQAAADGASAETKVDMQITGQPKLRLSGQDDRASAQAEAGSATPISLVVTNDGSAPATDIDLSSSPPSDWKVEFQPASIATLAPKQKATVQALLTPSAKAVAGDYMTSFRASAKGNADSSSTDFRISVATSTLWGIVGVGIIAIALLIAVGAVARFGRR